MDDIDCSKVKSAVHCVDDYMVAGAEKESSTNAGIHNNSAASSTVSTSGAAVTKVRPLRTKRWFRRHAFSSPSKGST
ncbi:hypothetical protein [Nitrososphaera sp.]|uniref:hypothetical protein n=1 Tax=Nitrososphaera sp. TaxID=1971748 RepID=UPI00307D1155